MNPVSPIASTSSSSNTSAQAADLLSALGDPVSATFEDLIGQLVLQGPSPSSGVSQNAILAQQKIADFQRKLALLSGMMEQARIAMDGQKPMPGGLPTPAAEDYYFVRSELAQVGLPGAVNDVV